MEPARALGVRPGVEEALRGLGPGLSRLHVFEHHQPPVVDHVRLARAEGHLAVALDHATLVRVEALVIVRDVGVLGLFRDAAHYGQPALHLLQEVRGGVTLEVELLQGGGFVERGEELVAQAGEPGVQDFQSLQAVVAGKT